MMIRRNDGLRDKQIVRQLQWQRGRATAIHVK